MSDAASETATRGILFTDLADSSRLYRTLGDARAREVVRAAFNVAQSVVANERGRVVDQIGDELFCLFDDGDAALRAAVGIQEHIERARETQELPVGLAFRTGFIQGPVELRDTEVFGDSVYLAKRVANLAKAEQILTTLETFNSLHDATPESFLFVERVRLKGRLEEVELVEALWGGRGTMPVNAAALPPLVPDDELHLRYGDRAMLVSRQHPDATMGRSPSCDLVLDEAGVSRLHARAELRRSGFVLVDLSRNGTILQRAGSNPYTVERGYAALEGEGTLQLGTHSGAPVVTYSVRPRRG